MSEYVVQGTIIDGNGVEAGYVILDGSGHVLERGKPGTLGRTGLEVHQGLIVPRPVNAHTHVGDSVWGLEPPRGTLADVVGPPGGLKHKLLSSMPREEKVAGMRRELLTMARSGVGCTLDFREEGLEGVRMLREAATGVDTRAYILGRMRNSGDADELRAILQEADGIGLSAKKDMEAGSAERVAAEVKRAGKFLALHASEDAREAVEGVLDLKPSLLIHLTMATRSDLESVVEAGVPIAFCPRSNALFGRWPPLTTALDLDAKILLGTDNAMFNAPDLFREMEFAYLTSRRMGEELPPERLFQAAFITPWEVLGQPQAAVLTPGQGARAMALRLPGKDPCYEACIRAGPELVMFPGPSQAGG